MQGRYLKILVRFKVIIKNMERKCQLSENTGNNIELDLVSVEKHHIQKVLQHTNGYKPEAARPLGIALTTLYRKMEAYGL